MSSMVTAEREGSVPERAVVDKHGGLSSICGPSDENGEDDFLGGLHEVAFERPDGRGEHGVDRFRAQAALAGIAQQLGPGALSVECRSVRARVVNTAVMALADRRILTFDVVGTLIDFEAGILGCLRGILERAGKEVPHPTLLAAFARAEDAQQHVSPAMPFRQMLNPIYERMAGELGLPRGNGDADRLAASIPQWPAFTDATDGLAALGARYRLVALT